MSYSYSFLLFLFCMTLNAQSFEFYNDDFIEATVGESRFCDIDNDGDLDLIVTGITDELSPETNVYFNDGNGNYQRDFSANIIGVYYSDLVSFDADMDGDLDLIVSGLSESNSSETALYWNDGSGNFSLDTLNDFVGLVATAIETADIDGDDDLDVFISGSTGFQQIQNAMYINDGEGNFSMDPLNTILPFHFGNAKFLDIENDGDLDLVVAGNFGNQIRATKLYVNDGSGLFQENEDTFFLGASNSSISIGDANNDGFTDILISGAETTNNSTTILYLNDQNGAFYISSNFFLGLDDGSVDLVDIDCDQDLDIFLTGDNPAGVRFTKVYLNDGAAIFSETIEPALVSIDISDAEFGDIDNDQDLDLFLTGSANGSNRSAILYENVTKTTSTLQLDDRLNSLEIYPNPSSGFINIQGIDKSATLVITNVVGVELLQSSNMLSIDLNHLPNGLYFLKGYSKISEFKTTSFYIYK